MTTAVVEDVHRVRATSLIAVPAFAVPVKAKLADLWPVIMIFFGVILTVAWCGGLFWLSLVLLLGLI
jgi:hypothetical protein